MRIQDFNEEQRIAFKKYLDHEEKSRKQLFALLLIALLAIIGVALYIEITTYL